MPRTQRRSARDVAEDTLLSAILGPRPLLDVVEPEVSPEDIHQTAICDAYKASRSVHAAGRQVTPEAIVAEASRLNLTPMDLGTLKGLVTATLYSDEDAVAIAKEVKRHAQLERIVTYCKMAILSAQKASGAPSEIADSLQSKLVQASSGAGMEGHDSRDVATDILQETMDIMNGKVLLGVSSGFRSFDRVCLGFREGQNFVVGARPGIGKSSVAMNFADSVASSEQKYGAVIFSAEMSAKEFLRRNISARAKVDSGLLLSGKLSSEQLSRIISAVDSYDPHRLIVDDSNLSIEGVASRARRYKTSMERHGVALKLIILDYVQLFAGSGTGNSNREQEVSRVSRGMKMLAKELRCTCITLSQLNRAMESRDVKRPSMADLRESGALEQDADLILLLHRESKYNANAPANEAEWIIAKQRAGPCGTLRMGWNGQLTKFYDIGSEMDGD